MKFPLWILSSTVAMAVTATVQLRAETQFEYAAVHFDGPSSRIIWPDGNTTPVAKSMKEKPDDADDVS